MATIFDLFIGLVLDSSKYHAGLKKAKEEGESSSKRIVGSFTEMKSALDLVGGALNTVGQIAQTAFEWGKEGAAVAQTAESFDLLLQKVGAAPDLLNQLRQASNGTISDMDLMRQTSLLLAGAQGDLAKGLSGAAPGLVEMAKAAEKLNPHLGTATEQYQSLIEGIKRGSVEKLDDLGIVVDMQVAYMQYAQSIGKSADELTAEERKLAVLNKTMEGAKILLSQVGGNTESATDAYAQLEVAIKQAGDEFKMSLEPAVRGVTNALTELLTGYEKLTKGKQAEINVAAQEAKTFDEYAARVKAAVADKTTFVSVTDGIITVMRREGQMAREVTDDYDLMSRASWDAAHSKTLYADGSQRAAAVTRILQETAQDAARAQGEYAKSLDEAAEAAKRQQEATAKLIADMNRSALDAGVSGPLTKALNDYRAKIDDLKAQNAGLIVELQRLAAEGADPAGQEFADLAQRLRDNVDEQARLRESTNKATKEMLYQKAAAMMDQDAALKLAEAMGILSNEDYVLFRRVVFLTGELDKNSTQLVEGTEITERYLDAMREMGKQTEVNAEGFEDLTGEVSEYARQAAITAAETRRLANAQAALDAGISGQLQSTMETYNRTIAETAQENKRLVDEYWELIETGQASGEQWIDLSKRIDENNAKQAEALKTMREATAQLIYQQAAQGLTADAAILLARELGVMSEEDYNLVVSLQELKSQFDANGDSMIDATEAANGYTAAVREIMNATIEYQNLVNGGGNGYVGNGIYVGGPGETIGPGAMPTTTTTTTNLNTWNISAPGGSGQDIAAAFNLWVMSQGLTR